MRWLCVLPLIRLGRQQRRRHEALAAAAACMQGAACAAARWSLSTKLVFLGRPQHVALFGVHMAAGSAPAASAAATRLVQVHRWVSSVGRTRTLALHDWQGCRPAHLHFSSVPR